MGTHVRAQSGRNASPDAYAHAIAAAKTPQPSPKLPKGRSHGELLDRRALGRATLARQMLLERAAMPVLDALEHLVGMQAQAPQAPYVGLWTRLRDFRPDQLAELISSRRAARAPLMRATLHLVSARDCLRLRPVVQSVLERSFAGAPYDISGVDPDALLAAGRSLLEQRPRSRAELAASLAERWRDHDAMSLAYAITYLVPVIQVPPRGLWGSGGQARWTTTEAWLEESTPPWIEGGTAGTASREDVVLRYLGAFGPATVRDVQTWSGLTRLGAELERLRPRLRTFRDEQGSQLFDLPDAPRPESDAPAPPRFLPEYDNLLLSHADRTRFMSADSRVPLQPGLGARYGTLLVDGFFCATWRITRHGRSAVLHVEPFRSLSERDVVASEGERLLRFAAADAEIHDVRFAASSR